MLLDLVKHHNVQLSSKKENLTELRVILTSHLSTGECAESDADGCMQLVTSFYTKSDVLSVLTKPIFQIEISTS